MYPHLITTVSSLSRYSHYVCPPLLMLCCWHADLECTGLPPLEDDDDTLQGHVRGRHAWFARIAYLVSTCDVNGASNVWFSMIDGQYIATAGYDNTFKLWNADLGAMALLSS